MPWIQLAVLIIYNFLQQIATLFSQFGLPTDSGPILHDPISRILGDSGARGEDLPPRLKAK